MSDNALEPCLPPSRTWRWPFGWFGLFALAWAVYELTHSPGIASVLICLKFGWEDFQTAAWLWKNDLRRGRRLSLLCLYLGWGLWKTAAVAFLMSVAYAAITPRNLPVPAAPQVLVAFLGTFVTTLAGFALSTLLTFLAVVAAWWGGFRLWLDRGVHRARRHDFWPPTPFCLGRDNRLALPLVTALSLTSILLIVAVLTLARHGRVAVATGFVLSIFAPVAIVLLREWISSRVWADSPSECWPEEWDLSSPEPRDA